MRVVGSSGRQYGGSNSLYLYGRQHTKSGRGSCAGRKAREARARRPPVSLNVRLKSSFLNDNAKKVTATELMLHKRRSKKFYHKLREANEIFTPEDSKYNNNYYNKNSNLNHC